MENLPDDLIEHILGFLSTKERIMMREIAQFHKFIKPREIATYSLSQKLTKIYSDKTKTAEELLLVGKFSDGKVRIYNDYTSMGIHSLFRSHNSVDRCVISGCREKRLGPIYINIRDTPISQTVPNVNHHYYWKYYMKRRIPYCLNCLKGLRPF
jgi:hypothetical protein